MGRLAGDGRGAHDRRHRPDCSAGIHRHPQSLGFQHRAGWQCAKHDPPGRDLDDFRRRRIGRAQQALQGFRRLLRAVDETGNFHQHRNLRGVERDLDLGARAEGGTALGGRTRPDAGAGQRGHGAGRARRGEFAERAAGIVDRYRHAGGDVRSGFALRRDLLDPHADGRPRRVRIGGGGDRDRTARERAGGHHSSEDRGARDVGADAGADRDDRGSAGARAGCAGQRLSVSRRAEQSVQHHSAVGA